jgi:hypothetical protein
VGGIVDAGEGDVVPAKPYKCLSAGPAPRSPRSQLGSRSRPGQRDLGDARPRLEPATPGRWRGLDDHTVAFRPGGLGFPLDTTPSLALPHAVHVVGEPGAKLTSTLGWVVPRGSTLRLQQLLAQQGYLPVDWHA